MNRRRFLGAAGAATVAGLAGCSTASGTVAPPKMPTELLAEGGWERIDEQHTTVFDRTYAGVTVTGTAHVLVYEDAALRREIAEKTLGQVSGRFGLLTATHVDFSPDIDNLPGGVGRQEVIDGTEESARDAFEARMREAGLANVRQTGTGTLAIDTGEDARLTTYVAEYPFEPLEFQVAGGESVTIEGGPIRVNGDLAVWHHGDYVLVAGGAYPGENFARSLSEDLSEAITVSVSIDLELTPGAYREEVREIVRAVE